MIRYEGGGLYYFLAMYMGCVDMNRATGYKSAAFRRLGSISGLYPSSEHKKRSLHEIFYLFAFILERRIQIAFRFCKRHTQSFPPVFKPFRAIHPVHFQAGFLFSFSFSGISSY